MEEQKEKRLVEFFNSCGIVCDSINDMSGIQISRDILLDPEVYNNIHEYIPDLKVFFSSSSYTSLQSSAETNQRWPLINIVRQTLKGIGYKLEPKRLCDGYDKNHKKKYRRIFIISKL
tara:strand:+ start:964 stop:1317 length:354 start_codon:yes stop_codon:yes gene_type:complete